MPLRDSLSNTWDHIQAHLFKLGPLTEMRKQVITVLEVARVDEFVQTRFGGPGRPEKDRKALARAFAAKAVLGLPLTNMLIERLQVDKQLRRLCGWQHAKQIPSESTFSRAFAEFTESELPSRVHEALIKRTHKERLVGHISRDATAIEAREAGEGRNTRDAQAQARPPQEGRGGREGTAPARAPSRYEPA
jgi:transposase